MSLYVIGDLHLHAQVPLRSALQRMDQAWRGHEARFARACAQEIRPRDTLVLLGDTSFGRSPAECERDFAYVESLPGRKVLVRGNHDQFWDAKKTARLNELYAGRLTFLQDGFVPCGDWALVGTKGFTFEGPFFLDRRGRVTGWDREAEAHARTLVERELGRLRTSFEAARQAGYSRYIMLLHYPPTNILEERSGFTDMAEEYGASQVIYAHCHGRARFRDSIQGVMRGVRYSLASGDFLDWRPLRVLG